MKSSVYFFCTVIYFLIVSGFPLYAQDKDEKRVEMLCSECSSGNSSACTKLEEMVLKHPNLLIRYKAFKCIENQSVLKQVALFETDYYTRREAARKITDQEALASVFKNSQDGEVRMIVLGKITDKELLLNAAKNDTSSLVRFSIITDIKDQETLKDLYANGNKLDREHIIFQLREDSSFLKSIVNDADEDIANKQEAVRWINDSQFLTDLALSKKEKPLRLKAIKALLDKNYYNLVVFKSIALDEKEEIDIREIAIENLKDKAAVSELAFNNSNPGICKIALRCLENLGVDVQAAEGKRNMQAQVISKPANHPQAGSQGTRTSAKKTGIRTDGLYYYKIAVNSPKPMFMYFRFFPNSTLVTTISTDTPLVVGKWLRKDAKDIIEGTYKIQDSSVIVISMKSETGKELTKTGNLSLQGFTSISALTQKAEEFKFLPVTFPKKISTPKKLMVKTGKNRNPIIEPVVKKTDSYRYDDAGRIIGVTTTVEIKATDPDGDELEYSWSTTNGNISTQGSKVIWERLIEMGQPGYGEITVQVTDGRGGKVSRVIK